MVANQTRLTVALAMTNTASWLSWRLGCEDCTLVFMMVLTRDIGNREVFITFGFLAFGGERLLSVSCATDVFLLARGTVEVVFTIGWVEDILTRGMEELVFRRGMAELVIRDSGSVTVMICEVLGKDLEVVVEELVRAAEPRREGGIFTVMVFIPAVDLAVGLLLAVATLISGGGCLALATCDAEDLI